LPRPAGEEADGNRYFVRREPLEKCGKECNLLQPTARVGDELRGQNQVVELHHYAEYCSTTAACARLLAFMHTKHCYGGDAQLERGAQPRQCGCYYLHAGRRQYEANFTTRIMTTRTKLFSLMLLAPAVLGAQTAEERLHNDWANLGRYRDSNAVVPAPKPGENRVVFMGNSITEG